MDRKLLLIDGHSIINRAFYGLPDLTNAEGRHTGAVYGFLNILFRFIDEEQPSALAVAFDVHAPTFRHEIYPEYKGKRKPMPEELRAQVPLLKEVLDAMGILRMEQAGLEADDLLGTAAARSEADGWLVTIVSGDRDLLQVASKRIIVAQPKTVRGQTTVTRYDDDAVAAEWGVSGERFIELKALMGDTSDNIPGLPKVGEKTAKDLMAQFGSGDAIFERAEEITKKGLRETVQAHRADYELAKTLSTIDLDAPFSFSAEAALFPGGSFDGYFTAEAFALYRRLGFKNLLSRFRQPDAAAAGSGDGAAHGADDGSRKPEIVTTAAEAEAAFDRAADSTDEFIGISIIFDQKNIKQEADGQLAFDMAPADGGSALVGVALHHSGGNVFLPVGPGISTGLLAEGLQGLSGRKRLSLFGAKECYAFFTPARILYEDDEAAPQVFDIKLAAYLLNPLKSDLTPEDIAAAYLSETVPSRSELFGKERFAAKPEEAAVYGAQTARTAYLSAPLLAGKLAETGMLRLFEEIEVPLSYILHDMERIGIRVRREELKAYGERLTGRILALEEAIHEAAGEDFNINSPKQLGEILFEKLKLPGGKKTKTGYSTAAEVLEKLADGAPIVRDILEYRGLVKLKSTYAEGLYDYIGADGCIHTSFHQTITATGRISSSDPNLQNIPMRTELGREIRRVFVPREGCSFADADYSQIELRILAAMSGDEALIQAYRENKDIHAITASRVFGVPFEEVTPLMRRNAKAVNFGIVYGISSFGLSQNIDISRSEAAEYIRQYFVTYPGVKAFLDRLVAEAKEKGYASTLYGRRRPVPELKSSNFAQRGFGERVAMNAPIQGTAADIMKIAMIRVFRRLRDEKLKSRMILQIHDELVIETAAGEEEAVQRILVEEMMGAAELAVPLEVDCHFGADWYEAK